MTDIDENNLPPFLEGQGEYMRSKRIDWSINRMSELGYSLLTRNLDRKISLANDKIFAKTFYINELKTSINYGMFFDKEYDEYNILPCQIFNRYEELHKLGDPEPAINTYKYFFENRDKDVKPFDLTFYKIYITKHRDLHDLGELDLEDYISQFMKDEYTMYSNIPHFARTLTCFRIAQYITEKYESESIDEEPVTEETPEQSNIYPEINENGQIKMIWKGSGKNLADLFNVLEKKGWIAKSNALIVEQAFTKTKSFRQYLKGDGEENLQLYQNGYQSIFKNFPTNNKPPE